VTGAGRERLPAPSRWGPVAIAAALLAVAVGLALVVGGDDAVTRADARIVDEVAAGRPAWLVDASRALTALGSGWWVVPLVAGAGAVLALRRRCPWPLALRPAATAAAAVALTPLAKLAVDRPRPPLELREVVERSSAYPSGHALQSAAGWLALGLLLRHVDGRRRWLALAAALTLAVGATRVVLGVHSPSDVLGGWAVGAALAVLALGRRA